MSSQELSHWQALFRVRAEELRHQRDVLESGDGQVIEYGCDEDDDEEDDPDQA